MRRFTCPVEGRILNRTNLPARELLHDNLDYKLQDIGRWVLDDRVLEPSIYS